MNPSKRKNQKEGNIAAKKNCSVREPSTMMSSLFEEDPAAVASTSKASFADNAATVTCDTSAGTSKYDAEPAATNSDSESDEIESHDENSSTNEVALDDMDDIIKEALAPQRQIEFGVMAEDYSQAVEAFARSPYGVVLRRDYKHDVFMAALDNVINQHIERSNPSEQRVANIKVIMNRFYQVMRIWIADGMEG